MRKMAGAWLRKAEMDMRCAQLMATIRPAAHDLVCFHSQEAVEKLLKALLAHYGLPIPETHFTKELLQLISSHDPSLNVPSREMDFLRIYSVPCYYHDPEVKANARYAKAALRWAAFIHQQIFERLRGRPLNPRKHS